MAADLFSIYNNWGHYDELGDTVPLTEALVIEELDTLERWQRQHDHRFDYFMIDCLWFEPTLGYRHFRKADWPHGPDRVFARIRALGMIPGLWFSTSGGRLNVPEWAPSRCANNWSYSLADGPYARALEDGFLHAAEQWGVRFFKLDFAHLALAAKGVTRAPQDTLRLATLRLKEIIRRVRGRYPDAQFITHCGYARPNRQCLIGAPDPLELDTGWLDVLRAAFAGDPHCTDIPQTSLERNVDLFQDRQVWKMHQSGFPLHRIEDHGAVMGPTNTAMYRGRKGFRRTHLGQLARGGRRDFLYGDPTVLTDDDVRGMKAARRLFFDAFACGLWTRFLGPGEPGVQPWHGYLTGGGDSGLLYIVNSSLTRRVIQTPLLNLFQGRVLFHDGRRPALQIQPEHLSIELGPEQVALIGFGPYADARWDLPPECDTPPPTETRLLELDCQPTAGGLSAVLSQDALRDGERLLAIGEALDTDPAGPLHALPFTFGKPDPRHPDHTTPHAHRQVTVRCLVKEKELAPERQIPDVPVWGGISWVARIFDPRGACRISLEQSLDPPRRLRLRALAIQDEIR